MTKIQKTKKTLQIQFLKIQNFSIVGKTAVFKTLAMSKIVHLALAKIIPISTIAELDKIKKHFIWKNSNPKIKQYTLCKDYV